MKIYLSDSQRMLSVPLKYLTEEQMKIYLSGNYLDNVERVDKLVHRRLLSYYYDGMTNVTETLRRQTALGKDLFLDSGAYSALTQNLSIPLEKYTTFVLEWQDKFQKIAGLDVIGDAEASMKNFRYMKAAGARIIPTFHYGEPFEALDAMLAECGEDGIGIGGVAQLGTGEALRNWLDLAWERIADKGGNPKVKVHGFAVTSPYYCMRYPWHSVDSTSWLMAGALGSVTIFMGGKLCKIAISASSPDAKKVGGIHYNELSPIEQAFVKNHIEALGTNLEECAVGGENFPAYCARAIVNIAAFQEMERIAAAADRRFFHKTKGLFD
jgi:hypothetical protein